MVAQVHTYNSGLNPCVGAGPGHIDVRIEDLNLIPGRYILSLYAANYGHIYHDVLPNCTAMEVKASNRYGLMRGITQNPIAMFACSWEMGDRQRGMVPVPAASSLAGSVG
jgi:hypothetical protein